MSTICVIPAAGMGSRMRPLSYTLPKAMLPVAGKPAIYHIIDKIGATGIKNFVIVTGYLRLLMEQEILDHYKKSDYHIRFVQQETPQGLAEAVALAEDEVENRSLLIVLGDTLVEGDFSNIYSLKNPSIGVIETTTPEKYGIVKLNSDKETIDFLVEKPADAVGNLAIPGIYFFPDPAPLFQAIHHIMSNDIKTKGEYQLTDALNVVLHNFKQTISVFYLSDWYDTGSIQEMLTTNRKILDNNGSTVLSDLNNCTIIDPVYIERGAQIKNSTIGPWASIGSSVTIEDSTIKNTIIDNNSKISNATLIDSIVGRKCDIRNITGSTILGDDSVIHYS